jgi:hypothetical protein
MKFSTKIKETIRERANDRCEKCGGRVANPQYHHRRPRGMGGTSREESGDPANALLLHPHCHAWIESNRSVSHENGWLVYQHEEPTLVPVVRFGEWCLLFPDGSARVIKVRSLEGKPSPHHSFSSEPDH